MLDLQWSKVSLAIGVAYLGVFQVGLAYVLLTRSIPHVPAVEASLLPLVEPALSPLWAWWLHGETPGPWPFAGGILIIGAAAWKALREGRTPTHRSYARRRQAPSGFHLSPAYRLRNWSG